MFESGYLTFGRIRGIPLRVHWTAPVAAIVFTRFRFVPGAWLGFFLLIFLHELGHAALVRHFRHRVVSISVHGLGGLCAWAGEPTAKQRAIVAWGGVLAQGAVLAITALVLLVAGEPTSPGGAELSSVFTGVNLQLIAINLLPLAPLDGAEAWKLIPILRAERRRRRSIARARAKARAETEALSDSDAAEAPMPEDVEEVLGRVLDEVDRERRAKRVGTKSG